MAIGLLFGCSKPAASGFGEGDPLATPRAPVVSAPTACDFTLADCTARCEAKDHTSCYRLARLLGASYLGPTDDARANRLFADACAAGVGDACNAVAVGVRDGQNDLPAAVPIFERACAMGSAKGCRSGGDLRDRWRGVTNPVRARELYERGCEMDQPATAAVCTELGQVLQRAGELEAAARALERGCRRGEARACTLFAAVSPASPVIKPSADELLALKVVNCAAGHEDSCFFVGAHFNGKGPQPVDAVASLAAFEKGCALEGIESCLQLANVLIDGKRGAPVDLAKAARAARVSCTLAKERNFPLALRGCRMYADRLAKGEGVAQDEAAAAALYIDTCETEPPFGCDEGAKALFDGRGVAKDEQRGLALLAAACAKRDKTSCALLKERGGNADALKPTDADQLKDDLHFCDDRGIVEHCSSAANLLSSGRSVPTDYPRALKYYVRACKAGNLRGCLGVATLKEKTEVPADDLAVARTRACAMGAKQHCTK
ncbi:MAG: hypothetical protein Q8O67_32535 [Deltaproteobacteria bacterium]|nr:hypothetical protein [Deltaproteobacteria bacterium]